MNPIDEHTPLRGHKRPPHDLSVTGKPLTSPRSGLPSAAPQGLQHAVSPRATSS
jgi:hypothetical protein